MGVLIAYIEICQLVDAMRRVNEKCNLVTDVECGFWRDEVTEVDSRARRRTR